MCHSLSSCLLQDIQQLSKQVCLFCFVFISFHVCFKTDLAKKERKERKLLLLSTAPFKGRHSGLPQCLYIILSHPIILFHTNPLSMNLCSCLAIRTKIVNNLMPNNHKCNFKSLKCVFKYLSFKMY